MESELELRPIPNYGDMFLFDEFACHVADGLIMDDDGSGNWATHDGMSDIRVSCADILDGKLPPNEIFTHVIWFNK